MEVTAEFLIPSITKCRKGCGHTYMCFLVRTKLSKSSLHENDHFQLSLFSSSFPLSFLECVFGSLSLSLSIYVKLP